MTGTFIWSAEDRFWNDLCGFRLDAEVSNEGKTCYVCMTPHKPPYECEDLPFDHPSRICRIENGTSWIPIQQISFAKDPGYTFSFFEPDSLLNTPTVESNSQYYFGDYTLFSVGGLCGSWQSAERCMDLNTGEDWDAATPRYELLWVSDDGGSTYRYKLMQNFALGDYSYTHIFRTASKSVFRCNTGQTFMQRKVHYNTEWLSLYPDLTMNVRPF